MTAPPSHRRLPPPAARVVFTRQLAALVKAGVPLLQGLDVISRGQTTIMADVVRDLAATVSTGTSLSAALARHPRVFPPMFRRLVAAAEASGSLDVTLERLAIHEERTQALRRQIRAALAYPAVVLSVACAVVVAIMVLVVPTFDEVFRSFGAELPWATRAVISAARWMSDAGWMVLGVAAGAVGTVCAAHRRDPRMRAHLDAAVLRLPLVGPWLHAARMAGWARTLATLYASGLPLVDALGHAAQTTGNAVHVRHTLWVQRRVATGHGLAHSMAGTGGFPAVLVQMVGIGEESGSLERMLNKAADFLESDLDGMVRGLSGLLEPIIIVVLGVVIGAIVLALYLPIFQLGSMS